MNGNFIWLIYSSHHPSDVGVFCHLHNLFPLKHFVMCCAVLCCAPNIFKLCSLKDKSRKWVLFVKFLFPIHYFECHHKIHKNPKGAFRKCIVEVFLFSTKVLLKTSLSRWTTTGSKTTYIWNSMLYCACQEGSTGYINIWWFSLPPPYSTPAVMT